MTKRGECRILFCCVLFFFIAGALQAQQPSDQPLPPPRNAVVEQLQVVYRFQNDGTGEVIQTARLRILTELGLKLYGAVYLPYSSQLEELHIDYLRTLTAAGKTIPADPSKAMDVTPPITRFAPMFSDVKVRVLVAPQVEVGDAIEYQYTRTIRTPYMPGNFWVKYVLDRVNPIKTATIILDVPAARKLTFEADPCFHYTVQKEQGRKLYRWQIGSLDPPTALRAYRPPLFAASTLSDWKQVADWYTTLQQDGERVTPDVQSLANRLTAGKTTPEQKLDAIYAYVSEKIRYVALEFGIGGYQAHAASAVLANGYGDCKDKAGLLQALLAAAGIKAYPALVNAVEDKIEITIPMPSAFDHVMTVVSLGGKTLWLDSTLQTAPPGVLSPAVIGKQALLVEPGDSRLAAVPDSPPVSPVSTALGKGNLDASGNLTLEDSMQAEGILGVLMRQVFRLQDKKRLENIVKRVSETEIAGATASDWSSSDPDNLSSPFKYQYKLARPAFIDLLASRQEIQIPHLLIGPNQWSATLAVAKEEVKQKSSGGCAAPPPEEIKLYGPFENQETLDLTTPANYQLDLPVPIQINRPFGSYTSSYSFDRGRLVVRRDLKINLPSIPLAQLDALDNFQSLVNADLNQKLTMRRTGNADILSGASTMTADELNTAGLEALRKHRQPMLARDLLLKAVAKDPKNKFAWNNLGSAYAAMGNFYQAEKAFKEQISLNPYDSYAYLYLGTNEVAQQHFDAAIEDFKRQLNVNPLDPNAMGRLAGTYSRQQDWADAADSFAKAVRITPGNPLLDVAWAAALLKAGKTDEGRQAIAQALEISKKPLILNNAAYALADAGIDLAKAEAYARSAVDQIIPAGATSLDVPKTHTQSLGALSSYLDTLGVALYKQDKLAEAGPCLHAAFTLRHDPIIAQHLAVLSMKQNNLPDALRYYSYTVAQFDETHPHVPKSLDAYLSDHGGLPEMTASRVAQTRKEEQGLNRLVPMPGHHFTWPHAAGTSPAWVVLNVLVNADGSVGDAKVFRGSEPYSSSSTADIRELHFPPLTWANHSLATVRTVFFLYDPGAADADEKVMALTHPGNTDDPSDPSLESNFNVALASAAAMYFMIQGHTQAGVRCLEQQAQVAKNVPNLYPNMVAIGRQLRFAGCLDAASAVLRQAELLQPKDDFALRELAETRKADGDRVGAIQAYSQLLELDPEDAASHYALGIEYEAEANKKQTQDLLQDAKRPRSEKRKSGKRALKAVGDETQFQQALSQYSQAANLNHGNAAYRNAYQALYQKVYHTSPPALANPSSAP